MSHPFAMCPSWPNGSTGPKLCPPNWSVLSIVGRSYVLNFGHGACCLISHLVTRAHRPMSLYRNVDVQPHCLAITFLPHFEDKSKEPTKLTVYTSRSNVNVRQLQFCAWTARNVSSVRIALYLSCLFVVSLCVCSSIIPHSSAATLLRSIARSVRMRDLTALRSCYALRRCQCKSKSPKSQENTITIAPSGDKCMFIDSIIILLTSLMTSCH